MRPTLLVLLSLTACRSFSDGALGPEAPYEDDAEPSGDGAYDTPEGDTGGGGGGGAEAPDDVRALRPAETDVYVFIANPDDDSVTRVQVSTLEVRTVPVGRSPAAVDITADRGTAVVFNRGDSTVTLLDADTLDARTLPVRDNLNSLALSPDGRWALLWHDPDAEAVGSAPAGGAVSYNEVSVVDLETGAHWPLVVGFAAKGVQFTPDGARALLIADDSLATLDLSGAEPEPTFLPIADPLDPPSAEEVEVAPDGTRAFIRQANVDALTVVDLLTGAVDAIPLATGPTDLDLTPQGRLLVVSRAAGVVQDFDPADPFAPARVVDIPPGASLGAVEVTADGSAIVYTTTGTTGRYATWALAEDAMTLHPLAKPSSSVVRTRDGAAMLVVHGTADNDDGSTPADLRRKPAVSLIDLTDQRTNTLSLVAPVSGWAISADDGHGFLTLEDRAVYEVLDFATLIFEERPLRSDAVFVGALPDLTPDDGDEPPAWVSQQHPLGRITFYDPDTAAETTLTGFALNGAIED
jgi:DNA-binding beta-propeller fold protein YncE